PSIRTPDDDIVSPLGYSNEVHWMQKGEFEYSSNPKGNFLSFLGTSQTLETIPSVLLAFDRTVIEPVIDEYTEQGDTLIAFERSTFPSRYKSAQVGYATG